MSSLTAYSIFLICNFDVFSNIYSLNSSITSTGSNPKYLEYSVRILFNSNKSLKAPMFPSSTWVSFNSSMFKSLDTSSRLNPDDSLVLLSTSLISIILIHSFIINKK